MCSNQCQCFGFTGGLQSWFEHNKALLCVSLNKQEGIWCLLFLLANTALTVTATIITAISVAATNNTTLLVVEVHTASNAKTKHPATADETVSDRATPGSLWGNGYVHVIQSCENLKCDGLETIRTTKKKIRVMIIQPLDWFLSLTE